jgi:uncharacterized C2H2 Zn-finger protein
LAGEVLRMPRCDKVHPVVAFFFCKKKGEHGEPGHGWKWKSKT